MIRSLTLATFVAACGAPAPKGSTDPNATVTTGPSVEAAKGGQPAYPGPVPVYADDPVQGSARAWVTVVEFSDFQCPFCSRASTTLERVQKEYGPDNVRLVWKNYPLAFHPHARPAAEVAAGVFATAGNDAFWRFEKIAFDAQKDLGDDFLVRYAASAGANAQAIEAGLKSHTWAQRVARDEALGKELGVEGTPGFLINGVLFSGAQPFENFKEEIDKELAQAKELAAKGVPRESIYAAASAANFKKRATEAGADDEAEKPDLTVFNVPVGKSPIKGSPDALVTIVEFSDFQCPYCKRVESTLKNVEAKYGSKVRFVWKNQPLPFHLRAEPAAEFASEARSQQGDAGFWTAHDKMFAAEGLEDGHLYGIASEMKLDIAKVKLAMAAHAHKESINADVDLAEDLQANGTPHFFINGRRMVGSQPIEKFVAVINEELAKSEALVAKGVKPAAVYETIIKNGVVSVAADHEKREVPAAAKGAPFKGSNTAKVVIYQFSDFQCPYCARVEPTLTDVMKAYGARVKLVWRDYPLPMHPHAQLAAEAAREALAQQGMNGFWKMHDLLYAAQREPEGLNRKGLDACAREMKLDMVKWNTALEKRAHKAAVDADVAAGHAAKLDGTPAFVINGTLVTGAQPYANFRRAIERALSEAK